MIGAQFSEVEADVHENIYYFYSKIENVQTLCSRSCIKELTLPFKFEEIFIECLLCARYYAYYLIVLYTGLFLTSEADIMAGNLHAP